MRTRTLVGIALVALPAWLVLSATWHGELLVGSDLIATFYYVRGLVGSQIAAGRLPVWDFHVLCGHPVLAAMQSGVLYPPSLLFAWLGPGAGWSWTVLLHLALAGGFAYRWLRSLGASRLAALAGGLAFQLSGHAVAHVYGGHVSQICAYAWLPACLWRLERLLAAPTPRHVLLLAAVVALLVLAGYPMFQFFLGLLFLARVGHHLLAGRDRPALRASLLAALGVAAGLLLAAPQLLPTLELIAHTQRAGGSAYEFSTSYSFPPENTLTLLAPAFFGDDVVSTYCGRWGAWQVAGFLGATTLALALIGCTVRSPRRGLWAGVAAVSFLLALGRYGPLFGAFHAVVPGAGFFRSPGSYLVLTALGLLPLAAAGLDRVRARGGRTVLAAGAVFLVLAVALGAARHLVRDEAAWRDVLAWLQGLADGPRLPDAPAFVAQTHDTARSALARAAGVTAAIGLLLAARGRTLVPGSVAAGLLVLVLATELVGFAGRFFAGTDESALDWPPEVSAFLARRAAEEGLFRIASVGRAERVDVVQDFGRAQLHGLDHVGGYDPMLLGRYAELMNAIVGREPDERLVVAPQWTTHPVLDMLGARYWIVRHPAPVPPGLVPVLKEGGLTVLRNDRALPRAFFVGSHRVVADGRERLRALAAPDFDPRAEALLEAAPRSGLPAAGVDDPEGEVSSVVREGIGYTVAVESAGGLLVLAESGYPGWTAAVDGERAELLRANHLLQAVAVPPGRHTVRFEYRSTWLRPGFGLAAATLLLLGGWTVAAARSRRP